MLFLGLLLERTSSIFYPLYQAAEKLLYPEDKMEEVLAWHMRLPEASELVCFLVLGYIFGHIFNTPYHYRIGFLIFGLATIAMIPYILRYISKA